MKPFVTVYISVPDMDDLARLFLDRENLTKDNRIFTTCVMLGGHMDEHYYKTQ